MSRADRWLLWGLAVFCLAMATSIGVIAAAIRALLVLAFS